jgi:acetylglutamate kinase
VRILVKVGGNALGEGDTTVDDLVDLQKQGHSPVVVHGGGRTITEWLDRLGIETRFVDGIRVTDEDSIDVVVGVLAGVMNKHLVGSINAAGGRAAGLAGADGGILRARIKDPALGLVGEVVHVDTTVPDALLAAQCMPVIAPIALLGDADSTDGTLLNVNADTAAAEIGAAMKADRFVFLTDVPGVCDAEGEPIPQLTTERARELIASGVITGGMIPKIESCLRALEGVTEAHIADGRRPHVLRDSATGTTVGTRIS